MSFVLHQALSESQILDHNLLMSTTHRYEEPYREKVSISVREECGQTNPATSYKHYV